MLLLTFRGIIGVAIPASAARMIDAYHAKGECPPEPWLYYFLFRENGKLFIPNLDFDLLLLAFFRF
jgi:hypothetical protein